MMNTTSASIIPRRRAAADIRLLRLELFPKGFSPVDDIGIDWSPVQPAESQSPQLAAKQLGVETWAPTSVVKARYRTLQLRYPADQFPEKHMLWRPAFELLSNAKKRLNWYWQSGLDCDFESNTPSRQDTMWDCTSVESAPTAFSVFK